MQGNRSTNRDDVADPLVGAVFATPWGPVSAVRGERGLRSVRLHGPQAEGAPVEELLPAGVEVRPAALADFAAALKRYVAGKAEDFRGLDCDLRGITPFRRRVLGLLRKVGYGRTVSYAGLAVEAGSPGAARAVGGAMAGNPLPLVIPCHRVLATDGTLGGYSAGGGTETKRALLRHEGADGVGSAT